jgi:prepilin-type N-terminal cleavage/methylation domain-containing protein
VRRDRGYTLIEVVVSLALFSGIIVIFAILTNEMKSTSKRLPVNFMKHPQISAVMARMRRDILDGHGSNPFEPERTYGYTQTPKTLVLETMTVDGSGGVETVVWDFREKGVVRRRSFNLGQEKQWVANGVPPEFKVEFDAEDLPGRGPWAVRVKARDQEGRVAIDQIFQPRAHD